MSGLLNTWQAEKNFIELKQFHFMSVVAGN